MLDSRAFPQLLTPSDSAFLETARAVWEERPDVREACHDFDQVAFRKWLGTFGVLEYPDRIAPFYPPVPPDHLRYWTSGGPTPASFLQSSVEDFHILTSLWRTFGSRPFDDVNSVFDFGCGCGRLARWLQVALPEALLHGSDVHRDNLRWCQDNLDGTFILNAQRPPVSVPDKSADLVFAVSVFSHVSEEAGHEWIQELSRICRDDGLILLSTHGAFTFMAIERSEEHQRSFYLNPDGARDLHRRLARDGFVFHALPEEIVATLDGVEAEYGQVFHSEMWVRNHWGDSVDLVAYVPTCLGLIQDVYVLRPR